MQVLTANRLREGDVVYWSDEGWKSSIFEALAIRNEAQSERLSAIASRESREGRVVDAYLIEVEAGEQGFVPLHYRERFRACGPSVRPDLGKQAAARM